MKKAFKKTLKALSLLIIASSMFANVALAAILPFPQGGTNTNAIPAGIVKSDGSQLQTATPGTDYVTPSGLTGLVPYTGATSPLNLGSQPITTTQTATVGSLKVGSLTGVLKAVSGTISTATAGTDYAGISSNNAFTGNSTFTNLTNLDNIMILPLDYQTNGCAGNSGATTFQACMHAMYASATSGVTLLVTQSVPATAWTGSLAYDINNDIPSMQCTPGVTLKYGGSAGTKALVFNFGNATGHPASEDFGCTFMGSSTLIAAGNNNTNTTIGVYFGGTNGAVAVNWHDNTINGFGRQLEWGTNAYMLTIAYNSISGGNGGGMLGDLILVDAASNSGELNNVVYNRLTDPGNLNPANAIYVTNAGTASNFIDHNSIDNAQAYLGASDGQSSFSYNHLENADQNAGGAYGVYIPVIGASSDKSSQWTMIGNEFANDNTASQWVTLVKHGGQLYAAGNHLDNYQGGTVTNFFDHSLDNGVESETICQTQAQGGTLTNIIAGGGNVTYSLANGNACWQDTGNSYPIAMVANASNVNNIMSGNQITATWDHSANWTFGISGSTYKLTGLSTNGIVTTSSGTGQLGVTVPATGVLAFLATPSSANLATAVTDETGSGALVFGTSPILITPVLGVATGTSFNGVALTAAGSSTTFLNGAGTYSTPAGTTYTAGTGLTLTAGAFSVNNSQSIATLSNLTSNGFVTTSGGAGTLGVTGSTGSGNVVLATSPTLTTPTLGVATATSINGVALTTAGVATQYLDATGNYSTPAGGGSGLTVGTTTISGGTSGRIEFNNAGVLGEKSVTGTGNVVLATSPTLVTPALGVATGTSLALGGATASDALDVTGNGFVSGLFGLNVPTSTISSNTWTAAFKDATTNQTVVSLVRPGNTVSSLLQFVPNGSNSTSNVNWFQGMFASSDSYSIGLYNGTSSLTKFSIADTGSVTINSLGSGLVKSASGVLSNATAGTDYTTPSDTESFTNKTIDTSTGNGNVIKIMGMTLSASGTNTGTINFPSISTSGTVATLANTQTFTNKTLDLGSNTLTATSAQLATAISDETGSGLSVFNTSPMLVTPTIGVASGTSLALNPSGTSSEAFLFSGRSGVTIPVPYVTPTQNNQNIAFDIFPKGTASNGFGNSDYGVAWQDICSTDIAADGTNYECLHIGKSSGGYGNVSMSQGGTGTVRNLELQAFGGNVGIHTNSPTSLFSVGSSSQFQVNSSGAIVAAAGISSSGTIAFSGLSSNGLVKTSGGTGTLSVATAGTDYQAPITLTTTGTSGAATLIGNTLNIPQYTGGGGGGLTVGTTTITSGTNGSVEFNNSGVLGEIATLGTGSVLLGTTTLPSAIVTSSLTSVGTIATGTWNGSIIGSTYGGTGVNNGSKTITLGGNFVTSGAFSTTLTVTANTNVTVPSTGTLAVAMNQTYGTTQGRWIMAGCSNGAVATNSTAVANTMYAEPFQVTRAGTAISISSDVEATGGTGSTAELGIYADNGNGLPGSLVVDAGSITTVGLGTHALTISTALTAGQYFAVILYSGTPSIKGFPTNGTFPCMGVSGTIGTGSPNNGAALTASQTFGALPSTFTTSPSYPTAPPYPIILVQMQ